jgi:hypothetical protein
LQKLKEQKALLGSEATPSLLLQIEDIEAELAELQSKLEEIELAESGLQPGRSDSGRARKEQILAELLSPMVMQLDRTEQAFKRWHSQNLYLEAKIIKEGNLFIRDLLLAKPHLIPPDLMADAHRLVTHYDRWLEEYNRLREGPEPDLGETFVFVGPKGYPFPRSSAQRFKDRYEQWQQELYGTDDS